MTFTHRPYGDDELRELARQHDPCDIAGVRCGPGCLEIRLLLRTILLGRLDYAIRGRVRRSSEVLTGPLNLEQAIRRATEGLARIGGQMAEADRPAQEVGEGWTLHLEGVTEGNGADPGTSYFPENVEELHQRDQPLPVGTPFRVLVNPVGVTVAVCSEPPEFVYGENGERTIYFDLERYDPNLHEPCSICTEIQWKLTGTYESEPHLYHRR